MIKNPSPRLRYLVSYFLVFFPRVVLRLLSLSSDKLLAL